jgi:hypothetical protein
MARNDDSNSNSDRGMTSSERSYWDARSSAERAAKRYRSEAAAFRSGLETYKTSLEEYKARKGKYIKEFTPWFKSKARAGISGVGKAFMAPRPLAPRTVRKKKTEFIGETETLSEKHETLGKKQTQLISQQEKVKQLYSKAKEKQSLVPSGYTSWSKSGDESYTDTFGKKYFVAPSGDLAGVEDPIAKESRLATPTDILQFKSMKYQERLYEQKMHDFYNPELQIKKDFTPWQKFKFKVESSLARETPEAYHGARNVPSGWEQTEKTASINILKVAPAQIVPEKYKENIAGRYAEGMYAGVIEKPLQTVGTFLLFKGMGMLFKGMGKVATPLMKKLPNSFSMFGKPIGAGSMIKTGSVGMGTLYAGSVYERSMMAEDSVYEFGKITSTEIIPMGLASMKKPYSIESKYSVPEPGYSVSGDLKVRPLGLRQIPIIEQRTFKMGPISKTLKPRATFFEPTYRPSQQPFRLKSGGTGFAGTLKVKQMKSEVPGIREISGFEKNISVERIIGKARKVSGKQDIIKVEAVAVKQRAGRPTQSGVVSEAHLIKRDPINLLESGELRLKIRRGEKVPSIVEYNVFQTSQDIKLKVGKKGSFSEKVFGYDKKVGKLKSRSSIIEVEKAGYTDFKGPPIKEVKYKSKKELNKIKKDKKDDIPTIDKPKPKPKPVVESGQVLITGRQTTTQFQTPVPAAVYEEVISEFARQRMHKMAAGLNTQQIKIGQPSIMKPFPMGKSTQRFVKMDGKIEIKEKIQTKSEQQTKLKNIQRGRTQSTIIQTDAIKQKLRFRTTHKPKLIQFPKTTSESKKTSRTPTTSPPVQKYVPKITTPQKPIKPFIPFIPFSLKNKSKLNLKKKKKTKIQRMAKYKPSLIGITMPEVKGIKPRSVSGIGIRRVIKK